MANLAYQKSKTTGQAITMAAAGGSGDLLQPNERGALLVRNADATSKTVTVAVPGTEYGQERPDIAVVVAAGEFALIGPLPADLGDLTDGKVHVTYSATTSVTVAAVII